MTNGQIQVVEDTIKSYFRFPWELRIAKYLYGEGVTGEQFQAWYMANGREELGSEIIAIHNHLRNFHKGMYHALMGEIPSINLAVNMTAG